MRKKVYGESRVEGCPFCGARAIAMNPQGIPVCSKHKDKYLDLKCICGEWLDVRKSKWGAYFYCMNCGNISLRKALEMNPVKPEPDKADLKQAGNGQIKKPSEKRVEKKEITITSDELDFLY